MLELGDTRLRLGLTALGPLPDPFQLVLDRLLAAGFLAGFLLQALRLLLQIGGVVAFIGEIFPAIEFQDPADDIVEKIAVVGDHQHRAGIFLEMIFQPFDTLGVKMVGRLVEQQDVRLLDQQAGQRDAALLTARQAFDRPVRRRAAQRLHRDFQLVVERPAIDRVDLFLERTHFLHQRVEICVLRRIRHDHADLVEAIELVRGFARAVLHILKNGLGGIELRLLRQIADADILARPGLAAIFLVDAGHDLDQRRLADAVGADDADLGTAIKLQIDTVEHRLGGAGKALGHVLHDESILRGGGHCSSSSEATDEKFGAGLAEAARIGKWRRGS